jgi:alpha-glucosidase
MRSPQPQPHHLLPHHDGSALYVSSQAPELGDVVTVRVRIPAAFGPVVMVRARSNPDREPRFDDARPLGAANETDGYLWWAVDLVVENPVHGYRFLLTMADGDHRWLTASGLHDIDTLDSEDFTLVAHPAPPDWAATSVMYQVFPDRFARSAAAHDREAPDWAMPADWHDPVELVPPGRSHQFYGGDLDGVTEHIDHLERLGVNLIYLTPVFPGRSNHRYDAAAFSEVDPLLGGDAALIRLVETAHSRGFRVIGDLTANHSGDGHEWFRAAHRTPAAPESDFYYWLDSDQTRYLSWLGVPELPKFNWNSAELRRRFIEGAGSVARGPVLPGRLADRRGEHDRPRRRRRPERRRAAGHPPHHDRGEPRHHPAWGIHQRRLGRLPGRRVARRHDLRELHPAALGLVVPA